MPMILCTAIGIHDCIQTWKKSAILIGVAYLISFILFFRYYFFVYPKEIYPQYLFDDTSYSTLIELKESWDIENHVIYTNINRERCGYIFILMANQIIPQEIDPLISSWYSHIGNFIFEIPEEINKNAIYLLNISQQNIEFENKLIHAGFQWQVNKAGTYRIYFFESQKH